MKKFNLEASFGNLIQDKDSDIRILELIKGEISLLIAELKPGSKLPAHYHQHGSEIYQVLTVAGKMELGTLCQDEVH